MEQTIEKLVQKVDSGRCVGIEVTNDTNMVFRSPRTYCFSGHNHTPPTPLIPPAAKGHCVFVKRNFSLRGSVGLLVYEIEDHTLAVMFSNPFDYNLYKMEFAVALSSYSEGTQDLKALFDLLYQETEKTWLVVAKEKLCESQLPLVLRAGRLMVTATMSNNVKAILKVHVEADDF
ncbi:DELTA-thalatoxin-Avl1a-like [Tachyglossus aculeatus]|uniref:DELTA-thalatoxin-Avl1a-like n=1 Tax=Tachyglossus aculeatus TaxID=9261 RepID=UPI0018F4175F|nr:DELTA-thalatoxin-Avl1a-like [Tachyglossus aculeatus]